MRSRDDENLIAPVAVSVLLHALIAVALMLKITPREMTEPPPPAAVALVWQPNPSRKLALRNPGKFKNAPPAEARPRSAARPSPPPSPPPSPLTAPPSVNQPVRPTPQQEATQAPETKSSNAEQAEATKKTSPAQKHEAQKAPPRNNAPTNLATSPSANPFANMTNLSLSAPSLSNGTPSEHSAEVPGPAPPGNPSMGNSTSSLDAPNASANWEAEMEARVNSHDFYPAIAITKHEEGITTVQVTIDKTGKVLDVEPVSSSGFDPLDDAWLSVFSRRTVPRPTPDMYSAFNPGGDSYTFRATLQYELIEEAQ